jgi:hypothetical protein
VYGASVPWAVGSRRVWGMGILDKFEEKSLYAPI